MSVFYLISFFFIICLFLFNFLFLLLNRGCPQEKWFSAFFPARAVIGVPWKVVNFHNTNVNCVCLSVALLAFGLG